VRERTRVLDAVPRFERDCVARLRFDVPRRELVAVDARRLVPRPLLRAAVEARRPTVLDFFVPAERVTVLREREPVALRDERAVVLRFELARVPAERDDFARLVPLCADVLLDGPLREELADREPLRRLPEPAPERELPLVDDRCLRPPVDDPEPDSPS